LDEAIADFTKAIQLKPNLAVAYHNRAYAYSKKNDLSKAKEDVRRAQDLKYPVDQTSCARCPGAKNKTGIVVCWAA
jgi:tetratricopeptide (TPR) repeat protein